MDIFVNNSKHTLYLQKHAAQMLMNAIISIHNGEQSGEMMEIGVGWNNAIEQHKVFSADLSPMLNVKKVVLKDASWKAHENLRCEIASGLLETTTKNHTNKALCPLESPNEFRTIPSGYEEENEYLNRIQLALFNIAHHFSTIGLLNQGSKQEAIKRNFKYIDSDHGMPKIINEASYRIGLCLKLFLHVLHESNIGSTELKTDVETKLNILNPRLTYYERHKNKKTIRTTVNQLTRQPMWEAKYNAFSNAFNQTLASQQEILEKPLEGTSLSELEAQLLAKERVINTLQKDLEAFEAFHELWNQENLDLPDAVLVSDYINLQTEFSQKEVPSVEDKKQLIKAWEDLFNSYSAVDSQIKFPVWFA